MNHRILEMSEWFLFTKFEYFWFLPDNKKRCCGSGRWTDFRHSEDVNKKGKKDIIISKMAKIIARMVIIFRAVCQYNLFQRSIIKIFTKTATTVWKSYLARCPLQHDFNLKITLYLKSDMHYQSARHAPLTKTCGPHKMNARDPRIYWTPWKPMTTTLNVSLTFLT